LPVSIEHPPDRPGFCLVRALDDRVRR
jgi:hypothetical protein